MNTLKNVQKVSLIFFIILGLAHIVSGLMAANNYYPGISGTTNKILDIPFAVVALFYGATSLKLSFANPDKTHTMLNAILIIGILIIIGLLIYINFFVPDLNVK